MTRGPASTRKYDTVFMPFGSFELKLELFSLKNSKAGVSRSRFTIKDKHPVGNSLYDKVTGESLNSDEVVNLIPTEKGPVYVADSEVEGLLEVTPNSMKILAYQPLSMFGDEYVPETPLSVEVAPKEVGKKKFPNDLGRQAFATLLAGMATEQVMALCEIVTRGVPKPAVLLPDGTMWLVYHDDELRERRPSPDFIPPLEAVKQVVAGMIKPAYTDEVFDLTDTRSAKILEYANAKAQEGDFAIPESEDTVEVREATVASTDDLMALLASSVAAATPS